MRTATSISQQVTNTNIPRQKHYFPVLSIHPRKAVLIQLWDFILKRLRTKEVNNITYQ